ncbi:MAG: hypothetical protein MK135_14780, partial [Polyangiaceae bacterium]|nr:hypothetical protein [Polyangiaceae bacterium]
EDLEAYTKVLAEKLALRVPHVVIVDASRGQMMRGTHRRILADWNRRHAEELQKYRRGVALVSRSAALRGMLTAVYWLFPPPYPHKMTNTLREAIDWARTQLERGD